MSKLREYRRRRDFERTPEPSPAPQKNKSEALRFVVQAHAARAMHYDFRLQVDDVLVSWAVPKGPSLDPRDRRLAIMTEDHPLEYASFEGRIPKGQYGGGSVIVWDEGTGEPEGNARHALEQGKLTFTLHGQKLRGRFHLTRTRGRKGASGSVTGEAGKSAWLLIKGRDDAARDDGPSIVEEAPASVLSGHTLEQVARAPSAVWRSTGADTARDSRDGEPKRRKAGPKGGVRKTGATRLEPTALEGAARAPFPAQRKPQLATLVSAPPAGDDFVHEAKLDGYRLLAEVREGDVKLWTRGQQDWTEQFPAVAGHLRGLPLGNVLLDGELVAFDERGISRFQRLQNARKASVAPGVVYVAFDLLHQDGYDLREVPLLARKAALAQLLTSAQADARFVRFSEHVVGNGAEFFEEACRLGLEGVVSKKADAPYRPSRSQAWLKCKCLKRQELVIGGYTEPSGSRAGLGALLVGLHDADGKLHFAGKVGTGFSQRSLQELHTRLSKLTIEAAPFVDPPRGAAARGVHWVRPELLAEVSFSEITQDGKLRHPSFQGLRDDKRAEAIQLERPVAAPQPMGLTHPDRVLYPDQGLTKRDLAEYYVQIAPWILPHVGKRLLTLVRCPGGQEGPCFYQKHAKEGMPEAIFAHALDGDQDEQFVYVEGSEGLVGLVQVGVLELHAWGSTIERLEAPDRLIFDLDPDPELGWALIVEGALDVRDELLRLGLQSFVKTTGGKGLHVTVPLIPESDWGTAKAFCKALAEKLSRGRPDRYVSTMAKEKRAGKIFIDYLRNARGATAVAPYSTRARAGAPVATPIAWQELERDVRMAFTPRTVVERLTKGALEPWPGFFEVVQTITPQAKRLLGLT